MDRHENDTEGLAGLVQLRTKADELPKAEMGCVKCIRAAARVLRRFVQVDGFAEDWDTALGLCAFLFRSTAHRN